MSIYNPATVPFLPDPSTYPPAVKLAFLGLGRPTFTGGNNVTPARAQLATLTVGIPLPALDTQRSLFLPAACPVEYDGQVLHESGFHFFPEVAAIAGNVATGGLAINSTYGFVFVFEWQDAQGKLHRSGASVPLTVTTGGADHSFDFKFSPLFLTHKQGIDSVDGLTRAVQLVVYRTVKDGNIFYRDLEVSRPTYDNTSNRVANNDLDVFNAGELTDANLVKSEILYVTGGALENQAFPSVTVRGSHQRRIFMAGPDFVQFTDEADDDFIAVATNEAYKLPVPQLGGSVVGLASMDDKLIIFCQHQIYFVSGEGPNRLGQQNGYTLPQLCSASLGMLGGVQDSIALTSEGLWFMSSTGTLRLLTRGLQIAMEPAGGAFLGRESDGYFESPFIAARALVTDSKSQVRWYVTPEDVEADGFVVVWDYQQQLWSKFTNHDSRGGSTVARGAFYHSDGDALFVSGTVPGTPDVATNVPVTLETAWIALDGIQGFQRVYSLMLLAQAVAGATINISVGFDYDETWISSAGVGTAVVAYSGPSYLVSGETGVPTVGATITGGTSGATATVFMVTGGKVYMDGPFVNSFLLGETITAPASWSATLGALEGGGIGTLLLTGGSIAPTVGEPVTGMTSGATRAAIASVSTVLTYTKLLFSGNAVGGFLVGETLSLGDAFRYVIAGAVNPLQIQHPLHRQKCESVRFRIEWVAAEESIRLTGMSLSVGVKGGLNRLPAANRF